MSHLCTKSQVLGSLKTRGCPSNSPRSEISLTFDMHVRNMFSPARSCAAKDRENTLALALALAQILIDWERLEKWLEASSTHPSYKSYNTGCEVVLQVALLQVAFRDPMNLVDIAAVVPLALRLENGFELPTVDQKAVSHYILASTSLPAEVRALGLFCHCFYLPDRFYGINKQQDGTQHTWNTTETPIIRTKESKPTAFLQSVARLAQCPDGRLALCLQFAC